MDRNKLIGIVSLFIAIVLIPVMIDITFSNMELTDRQLLAEYWYIYFPFVFFFVVGFQLYFKDK